MPKQRDSWRQPTPQMQMHVICMSLEGHFSNFKENLIDREKYVEVTEDLLQQFRELLYFNEHPKEWVPYYEKGEQR